VHLPPFLAELLTAHRERNPDARFVFTGANGGLHRRSNFRRRASTIETGTTSYRLAHARSATAH
jgi:hypothetical protein